MKQARAIRIKKGLTLFEVAQETGINQSSLSRFETTTPNAGLSLESGWKLAAFYGCTLDELLRESTEGERS